MYYGDSSVEKCPDVSSSSLPGWHTELTTGCAKLRLPLKAILLGRTQMCLVQVSLAGHAADNRVPQTQTTGGGEQGLI